MMLKQTLKILFSIMTCVCLWCICVSTSEALYTWTDENGVKHFSDTQPEGDFKKIGDAVPTDAPHNTGEGMVQSMKMPVNGSCDDYYLFIEDVCVHPGATNTDADAMKSAIDEFKRTFRAPPMPASSPTDETENRCTKAKRKLEKYLHDGVSGYNLETGKLEKLTGEDAEQAIQSAREDADLFCNEDL